MFKVIIDIDADNFEPPHTKNVRIIGTLSFPLTPGIDIAPFREEREGYSEFEIQPHQIQWIVEGPNSGYFHAYAGIQGNDLTPANIKKVFRQLGWQVGEIEV